MQDKLHETIKQLEDEKSLWLQKLVGACLKNLFCFDFSESFIWYCNFREKHCKGIHHSTSILTFTITTASIQPTCFHDRNEKDLSKAYLHLPLSSLQFSTLMWSL